MSTLTERHSRVEPMRRATIALLQRAYWKRPVVAVVSFLVPAIFSLGFPLQAMHREPLDGLPAPGFAMTGMLGFSAVFCCYIVVQAVTTRRASMFYKRLRAGGVRPQEIFTAEGVCALVPFVLVMILGCAAGIAAGAGPLGARLLPLCLIAIAVAVIHVLMGLAIVSLVPSQDLGMFVVSPILIGSMYLSGVTFSVHDLAPGLLNCSRFLPLSASIDLMRATIYATYHPTAPWWQDILCLMAWGATFIAIIWNRFSWDPRRKS